jgi:hypothetical protein
MDRQHLRGRVIILSALGLALALSLSLAGSASAQWVVKSEDGKSSVKLGLLMQGRAEWVKTDKVDAVAQELYLRRARVLLGGKVNEQLAFFFETDNPGIGRLGGSGKDFGSTYVQDFIATWTLKDAHVIDAGLLLTPGAYNHLQGAGSLLALDYGPYSFIEASPLGTKVGRDVGLQARGLALGKKLEYRAGLFQGLRGTSNTVPFRFAGRVSFYPWATGGTGYFYSGSNLGASRTLSVGVAADLQKDYKAYSGDLFFEQPLATGTAVTVQFDVVSYDGGDWVPGLPKQMTWMGEGGYSFSGNRLAVVVQAAGRNYDADTKADDSQVQGGLVWRLDGNRANLKLMGGAVSQKAPKSSVSEAPTRTMFSLQYQLNYF